MATVAATDEVKKAPLPVMLCLHGYGHDAKHFNDRLDTFRAKIKKKARFLIPYAPHRAPPGTDETSRCWYTYPERFQWKNGHINNPKLIEELDDLSADSDFHGLEKSINEVRQILANNPDIRYVMGFSQGASLLAMMVQRGYIDKDKKLIFIGASAIKMSDDVKFPHRSVHYVGETDKVVGTWLGVRLAAHFENPTTIIHTGGHVCPRMTATVFDAL